MTYANLKSIEKILRKRIDWDRKDITKRDIEIRNECIEALYSLDSDNYIDISNGCEVCSTFNKDYNRKITAIVVDDFNNKSNDNCCVSIKKCNYCPSCGAPLRRGEDSG